MKKAIGLGMIVLVGVGLSACGNDSTGSSDSNTKQSSAKQESVAASSQTAASTQEASSAAETKSDSVYEDDKSKFVIKGIEQIENAMFPEKPILAVEVEFTNKSDESQDPWMALATSIRADQETDTTEELLTGANGQFPEDYKPDLVKMGGTKVKSGATVEAVIGFDILYPGSPVIMQDFMKQGTFYREVETTE